MHSNCAAIRRPCFSLELVRIVKRGLRTSIQWRELSRAVVRAAESTSNPKTKSLDISVHPINEDAMNSLQGGPREMGIHIPIRRSLLPCGQKIHILWNRH